MEKTLNILILRSQAGRQVDTLNTDLLLKLEFPSDPELLFVVRGAMERLTERMGFSERECRSVTRAVDEAVTNIIRHAYSGPAESTYRSDLLPPARTGTRPGNRPGRSRRATRSRQAARAFAGGD